MLPANNRSSTSSTHTNTNANTTHTTTNTNRCLIKSTIERTVVRLRETAATSGTFQDSDAPLVEFDIINYYADDSGTTAATASVTPRHQLSSSRHGGSNNNNNNNSGCHPALDVSSGVVVAAPAAIGGAQEEEEPEQSIPIPGLEVDKMEADAKEMVVNVEGGSPAKPLNPKKQRINSATPTNRLRGGGGAAQSRLRRSAAIIPARSIPESCSSSNSNSSSSSNSNSSSSSATGSTASTGNPSPCSSLGVNMRVTGQCSQGGRKYMEDQFSVAYQESPITHELEYAFFGIYDGHGGPEAALFAKEHLMLEIVKQKQFWSDEDEDVLRAIREGYIATHFAMWREQENWPRTANGHLSTAGTTATVAFMRREKIYIGHVGDSGIVLGYQNKGERNWRARPLTTDHKPESLAEKTRIQRAGGNVAIKSGVPRVVWNRPRDPMHRGPIRRRTVVDDIPFLAVARSLGDLWSYNSRFKEFVVSPDPDVKVVKINPSTFRCLIFGTDGLWNVVTAQEAVDSVRKEHLIGEILNEQDVMNPSKALVDQALKTWAAKKMRADNTSVVTVILTPAANNNSPTTPARSQSAMARDTDLEVELLLEEDDEELPPLDVDNNYPDFLIEEDEYVLDQPYSALAKRHSPPEAFRDFDYFGLEEDELEEDEETAEEEEEEDEEEEIKSLGLLQQSLFNPRKAWRKSTINNSWSGVTEPEPDPEPDRINVSALDLYSHTSIDKCAIYGSNIAQPAISPAEAAENRELCELEQHLESSYSFAESYNSLLNEQEEQEARSRSAAAAAAAEAAAQQATAHSASVVVDRSMLEIIQEQQHYQQQEGYSLTQLETRRERERLTESWPQQPAELLELDALLQQERAEEEQVALEQQQQREQQMEVEAISSSGQHEFAFPAATEWSATLTEEEEDEEELESSVIDIEMQHEQELQDNEVSSTLPATPTHLEPEQFVENVKLMKVQEMLTKVEKPLPKQEKKLSKKQETKQEQGLVAVLDTVAEIRKEDAHAVHYIFERIQKLQDSEASPVAVANSSMTDTLPAESNGVGGSMSAPRIRQMRRYRNVPNENHQHMQTRRRQIFKHVKPKSFIQSSAAAIVAYGDSSETVGGTAGSSGNPAVGRVGGGGGSASSGSNPATAANRRRSVNVVANASGNNGGNVVPSSSMMMTRRSHSSTPSGGVNKRQLRSSLCSLGLGAGVGVGLGLDMTKRTLRTRNVPASSGGSATPSSNSSPASGGSSPAGFTSPANPGITSRGNAGTPGSSARRLKRSHDDREQRRSLRRSTLSGSASGSGLVGSGSPSNPKPNRLQACNGAISARPPPSPKKLNAAVPTLAIGTRAYTAALAAAADHLNKRWSLRSSSGNSGNLITAISCYSARNRAAAAAAAGTGGAAGSPGSGGGAAGPPGASLSASTVATRRR
ncbi:uncharacterized protein LOC6551101 [Drosophila erecta]|uniref:PPM-type phosphatase domain-containing protein n=1 Tax=Drosophila erecta TaxID=7220 RepID=B3NU57_DROER|nr:uncharacterized protein LOC6551101 [Drosophila erecta]EDV45833.1 uncharacterized protein Dere_GG18522 [Drosophila erecta]